ncbi:MAG: sensor histidine kinase, partial [Sphingomonas sp.]
MRFNDMIATVLAASGDRPQAREAQWRQLVDLLAQPQPAANDRVREDAYAFLRMHRAAVEPSARTNVAASLAGLAIDPDLLVFFAEDRAEIAAPLLRAARLRADDWLAVLPRLGPTARSLLRHRRDLPDDVRRALAAFGPADLVLGKTEAGGRPQTADAEVGESQIRELVERIEAYQRRRREPGEEAEGLAVEPVSAFRWETGAEGVIRWVDDAPRGPLIGLSVAGREGLDEA